MTFTILPPVAPPPPPPIPDMQIVKVIHHAPPPQPPPPPPKQIVKVIHVIDTPAPTPPPPPPKQVVKVVHVYETQAPAPQTTSTAIEKPKETQIEGWDIHAKNFNCNPTDFVEGKPKDNSLDECIKSCEALTQLSKGVQYVLHSENQCGIYGKCSTTEPIERTDEPVNIYKKVNTAALATNNGFENVIIQKNTCARDTVSSDCCTGAARGCASAFGATALGCASYSSTSERRCAGDSSTSERCCTGDSITSCANSDERCALDSNL